MAMAVTTRGAVPIVASTLQGRIQFGLEHLLDEASNATANRRLQRVKPILPQEWLRLDHCSSLFHGVISWRPPGRLLG
jgi:siroheme synthase (precorrin-2 oxidase/ferrochelatase)